MALPVALLKLAWKFLGPTVTALALKWGEEAFQRLRDILRTKQAERRVQAQQKARVAETQARQSGDATEAAALRAQAQVWREVAEQYAQDNKVLQAELAHLRTDLEARGRAQARAFCR
jgi:hypothetical protein